MGCFICPKIILPMPPSIFPLGPAWNKMGPLKSPLATALAEKIRKSGPMRFDLFMQASLYHEEHGFYASGQVRTGTQGDFLTPVSAGPVLGQLLARQADEWHAALGRPSSVLLAEQGADRGFLAADLLHSIASFHPELRAAARMQLVEPLPSLAAQQKERLHQLGDSFPLHWHHDLADFNSEKMPCFFYSSELVDSFPVRLVRHRAGTWQELFVHWADGSFDWSEQPASPDLLQEIQRWKVPPIEGFTTEIRPSAGPWIRTLGQRIPQGLILTLDYGLSAPDLYHPTRSAGTLSALRAHLRSPDPLADPGHQDLTSHVNFTELTQEGEQEEILTLGLADFSQGLTRLAEPLLSEGKILPEKWTRNFQHLTHPGFFGKSHRILVQGKKLPGSFQPTVLGSIGRRYP